MWVFLLKQYQAIWCLLSRRFRIAMFALFAGTILNALLEIACLSLLGTILTTLTTTSQSNSSLWFEIIDLLFKFPYVEGLNPVSRLVIFCGFLYTFKNVFAGYVIWLEATYAFRLQTHVGDVMLSRTLRRPYEEVAARQRVEYLNLMSTDLTVLVLHIFLPTLTIASESLLLLSIMGFLLFLEPAMSMTIIAAIGAVGYIILFVNRRNLMDLGHRRQVYEDQRLLRLRQIFDNLREIYVYKTATWVGIELHRSMEQLAKAYRGFQIQSTSPRFILELVLIFTLLGIIFFGMHGPTRSNLIVSVGIFAAGGFRLLLGINRILMGIQSLRFGQPAFEKIRLVIESCEPKVSPQDASELFKACGQLYFKGVTYRHAGQEPLLLNSIDLLLQTGEMVGIVGPSGAGKSTLLEIVCGLRSPERGDVYLDGLRLDDAPAKLLGNVGYVGQSPAIFAATIKQNVAYGAKLDQIDDEAVWAALEFTQLAVFVKGLPGQLNYEIQEGFGNLSGGQAQRLALSRAVYAKYRFLILDEPTSALDAATESSLVETLEEMSKVCGIVIVSHRQAPLESCSRIYALSHGRLLLKTQQGSSETMLPTAP